MSEPAPRLTLVQPPEEPHRHLLGRVFHRTRKALDPRQLMLSEYQLKKSQRLEMFLRGLAYSQVAGAIGSAFYYLVIQRSWGYQDPHGAWVSYLSLKDPYDRLPNHLRNLFHLPATSWLHGQVAPGWWVAARHDFRHVFIGVIATLLIGSLTIGLSKKERKRVPNWQIPARFAAAVPAALLAAAPLIFVFAYLLPEVMHVGFGGSGWLAQWLGKGSWQLTLIGVAAGLGAKIILRPAEDTLQLISLEKKLQDKQKPRWWWKIVYSATYRNRYGYLVESDHVSGKHGQVLGVLMALSVPIFLGFLGFGIWLDYFSGILPH